MSQYVTIPIYYLIDYQALALPALLYGHFNFFHIHSRLEHFSYLFEGGMLKTHSTPLDNTDACVL